MEIDKTNMPIVTTQVTRDYFRLDGNNVPLSINQIEKIIGTDASQFINEPSVIRDQDYLSDKELKLEPIFADLRGLTTIVEEVRE